MAIGKQESTKIEVSHFPLFCMVIGLGALLSVLADGQLEPMAGTGGVIRDAERRALTRQEPVKEAKAIPDIKASRETAPDPKRKAIEGKVVGPIANVRIFGSTSFAEKEGIAGMMLAELGQDGDKTVGDILKAMEKVRSKLLER